MPYQQYHLQKEIYKIWDFLPIAAKIVNYTFLSQIFYSY